MEKKLLEMDTHELGAFFRDVRGDRLSPNNILNFIFAAAKRSRRFSRWWRCKFKAQCHKLGRVPLWKPKPPSFTNYKGGSWFWTRPHWSTVMSHRLWLEQQRVSGSAGPNQNIDLPTFTGCARISARGTPIFPSQANSGLHSCTHMQKVIKLILQRTFYAARFL